MISELMTHLFGSQQQLTFTQGINRLGLTPNQVTAAKSLETDGTNDPNKIRAAACLRDIRYGRVQPDTTEFEHCARRIRKAV